MRTGRAGEAVERVWPLAALALGMVILGAAAASGHLFGDANPSDGSPQPTMPPSLRTTTRRPVVVGPAASPAGGINWAAILFSVALAGLAMFVISALIRWLNRRKANPAVALMDSQPAPFVPELPTLQEDLLAQARIAQDRVRGAADVGDAVIAAYVSFEGAVARSGVARLAHETSGDLLLRVLRSTPVPATAAAALVGLYERVRFGTAPSDEAMRASAQDCLAAIEQSLAGVTQ